MTDHIEVKIEKGRAQARRRDGLPLTQDDRIIARRLADELRAKQPGITVADVMRIFSEFRGVVAVPGPRIVEQPIDEPKPLSCDHCNKETVAEWRRGGRVEQHVAAEGSRYWACGYCGRKLGKQPKQTVSKSRRRKNA